KRENYKHDYPFCWRCKTPLIYFARGGWFIRTTQEIGHVIENNKKVDWHPEHIKEGRFGSFLESNIDWALSRERYWGTPLPVWQCECGHQAAVGSFEELKEKPNAKGLDAFDVAKKKDPSLNDHLRVHKPWIDAATFACEKCGKDMKRVTEVIDCWYDSGAMPFAQWGYPHVPGSKEKFNLAFPADFISEAIDQTRGWFYSLMAEAVLLKDSFAREGGGKGAGVRGQGSETTPLPYKTCLVLGHVCDDKGEKMSKSKGNYLDPNLILNEEGADALRWFFYSTTNPWTSARFSRPAVREAQKEFLIKLRNVYSFFVIYANIDGFHPDTTDDAADEVPLLDRWMDSELEKAKRDVRAALDDYDIFKAAGVLNELVESLSNWWLRRSRDRFWMSWESPDKTSKRDQSKRMAYWTLYNSLCWISQLSAPFVPFFAEEMFLNLARVNSAVKEESVHLTNFPEVNEKLIDEALALEVALVREVASLGRNARAGSKLKTRQPLSKVVVVLSDAKLDGIIRKHEQVLLDELNVKQIEIAHQADQFVTYELKPNFKAIGSKFRESVPLIKEALSKADAAKMRAEMAAKGKAPLALKDGKTVELSPEEVEVSLKAKEGYAAASGKSVVVVLDTHLTPELLDEGVAREIVSRIQNWRRDLNLAYEQRIKLVVSGSEKIHEVVGKLKDYISGETLAVELTVGSVPSGYDSLEEEVEGEKVTLGLLKA
ncbi:MAG TPA: class I tRNA ligase family protein, partial [Planctomycetota bacterium]|nr:class I tRNA ligase family protein [Planctomycetota bacterium]